MSTAKKDSGINISVITFLKSIGNQFKRGDRKLTGSASSRPRHTSSRRRLFVPIVASAALLIGIVSPLPSAFAASPTIQAIPGVTIPVTGATPVSTITSTAEYSGTVAWSGTPLTFVAGVVYTATITLTCITCTDLNVSADFYSVAGATATNSLNSGVVTAVFAATASTITYAAGGGLGTAPTQVDTAPGNTFTLAAANSFTRLGYTFSKWNDGNSSYDAGTLYTMPSANVILTAVWTADTNNITYNNEGATTAESGGSTTYTTGAAVATLPTTAPLKTGYTFAGWFAAATGGTALTDGTYTPSTPFGAITLYAQWTALPMHTVTFNSNGGAGSMTPQVANVAIALTQNAFTYSSSYYFSGWNTSAVGSGTAYSNGATYPFTADVTLYAQWSLTQAAIDAVAAARAAAAKAATDKAAADAAAQAAADKAAADAAAKAASDKAAADAAAKAAADKAAADAAAKAVAGAKAAADARAAAIAAQAASDAASAQAKAEADAKAAAEQRSADLAAAASEARAKAAADEARAIAAAKKAPRNAKAQIAAKNAASSSTLAKASAARAAAKDVAALNSKSASDKKAVTAAISAAKAAADTAALAQAAAKASPKDAQAAADAKTASDNAAIAQAAADAAIAQALADSKAVAKAKAALAKADALAGKGTVAISKKAAGVTPVAINLASKYSGRTATIELGELVKGKWSYRVIGTVTLNKAGNANFKSRANLPKGSVISIKLGTVAIDSYAV